MYSGQARGGITVLMTLSNQTPQQENPTRPSSGEATADPRFLAVMRESADVFCILTPLGEMQDVSPSWQTFTGQRENESRGKGWLEAFHPAEQSQVEETLIQTVISGRGRERTGQIRRYDKSYRLMYWRLIPVREPSGSVSELIACGTDITAQDQARQLSEAQLQLALEASGVGIWD